MKAILKSCVREALDPVRRFTSQQSVRMTRCDLSRCFEGMIGFDIACETARSGPRMQGYLVNDLCKI